MFERFHGLCDCEESSVRWRLWGPEAQFGHSSINLSTLRGWRRRRFHHCLKNSVRVGPRFPGSPRRDGMRLREVM
ncbi:hypothetical protein JOB18_001134 [Solea senegalensis]|uniref:Uncharacterized protein n=1 Tax=Solea senegalensis TaxID=28829 RepID=A0AAV6S208_SOLSE|nr:hypothetical protein JOB18_001134 [Solea senegalensis]